MQLSEYFKEKKWVEGSYRFSIGWLKRVRTFSPALKKTVASSPFQREGLSKKYKYGKVESNQY